MLKIQNHHLPRFVRANLKSNHLVTVIVHYGLGSLYAAAGVLAYCHHSSLM